MELKVGELFDKDKKRYMEGCKIDLTDEGLNLYLFFTDPTEEEKESCKNGDLTFQFLKLDEIIFFIAKIGLIATLDCPYSVHLSNNLTKIEYPEKNTGLSLVIYLINAKNGILEAIRLVALGEEFSRKFIETIKEQGNAGFNIDKYNENLNNIYRKYSTKQLEKMCMYRYKIRKE